MFLVLYSIQPLCANASFPFYTFLSKILANKNKFPSVYSTFKYITLDIVSWAHISSQYLSSKSLCCTVKM